MKPQQSPLGLDSALPLLSVVVPAYNEVERIGASLKRMLAYFDAQPYAYELLVVDDGSTDGTAALVNEIAETHPALSIFSYAPNRGKGHAVRTGMLRTQGDYALFCDADLATPIEEIEKLFAAVKAGSDIAIGSRDVAGSQLIRRQSFLRETGGRTFNKMVQMLAVPGIHDTQCGFKLFTRRAAHSVFGQCQVDHFAFDVEALYIARKVFGYSIAEIPVRWAHQEGSKVRFLRDAVRMVKTLFRIRLTRYDAPAAELRLR